jgi:molecular chaperone DnaK
VLPAERVHEFYTMMEDQERVDIDVFQGESRRCSDNKLVGSFALDLDPAPFNTPIRFRIAYDLDGVVRVTASQQGGPERSASMQLPDSAATPSASEQASDEAAAPSESAVVRRARQAGAQLQGPAKQRLDTLIARWVATPSERESIEDALLDELLALEED